MRALGPQRIVVAILILVLAGVAGSFFGEGEGDDRGVEETPLLGVTTPPATFSAWDLISGGEATRFAELADEAGSRRDLESLVDADRVPLERTIFAPTNEALAAFEAEVDLTNPLELVEFISYHAVDGANLRSSELAMLDGQSLTTILGQPVDIRVVDDAIVLNGVATVISSNVTDNGVVHIIDMALQAAE